MKRILMPLLLLALALGLIMAMDPLMNAVSSPPPVDAPTHVGQPEQWRSPTVIPPAQGTVHAVEQSLHATGGCRGWNGVQVPCNGNYGIYFSPSDELWVRYINAFVGHGWAGNWPGCERSPPVASPCQYWLTVDPNWFDYVFTAYPNGIAVIWNTNGALVGFI